MKLKYMGSSLDLVCYLVNSDGAERQVFCAELPVTSAEAFRAAQLGIKAEKLLTIDLEEYDEESYVIYDDYKYKVNRTYPRNDGLIELHLISKVGVRHG